MGMLSLCCGRPCCCCPAAHTSAAFAAPCYPCCPCCPSTSLYYISLLSGMINTEIQI